MSETPGQPGEYDRRAQAWVKARYGVTPDLGSVEFSTDCAAYDSGGWAKFSVDWTVDGQWGGKYISEEAWQLELTEILRELFEAEPLAPEEAAS